MTTQTIGGRRSAEFIALLALSIALAALGIDVMLPAFGSIRAEFGLPPGSTTVGWLVTSYFLGLAVGQLAWGPVSDRLGRRPVLQLSYALYALGALIAALSPTLTVLLVARAVWGLGAAGPRVVTIAAVRDVYDGDRMSRAMSFVMAVFILVPVIAPTIGAAIVTVADWRWVFGFCVLAAAVMAVWAQRRLPETLPPDARLELRLGRVVAAARLVASDRRTVGYTIALTALFGAFISYISTSEVIIGVVFDLPALFPIVFGGLALVLGAAMLANARIVGRLGTRRLAHGVLAVYLVVATAGVLLAAATDGRPPLWAFLAAMAPMLASHALLIPNLTTLAMLPHASVAGTASALIGAIQVAGGALVGAALDSRFDGTVLPLTLGFLGAGAVAAVAVVWAERGRLFAPMPPAPAATHVLPATDP